VDWQIGERDALFLDFVRRAFALRRSLAIFRRSAHFTGARGSDGARDLSWHDLRGQELAPAQWETADAIVALYDGRPGGEGMLALLLNLGGERREFALPWKRRWRARLATATSVDEAAIVEGATTVAARSLVLLQSRESETGASM
jgi:pullulanase/glycogen debranching enzyme